MAACVDRTAALGWPDADVGERCVGVAGIAEVIVEVFKTKQPIAVPQPRFTTRARNPPEFPGRRRAAAEAATGVDIGIGSAEPRPGNAAGAVEEYAGPGEEYPSRARADPSVSNLVCVGLQTPRKGFPGLWPTP